MTSNSKQNSGYFRTPIAAAMLCGVIAGAASMALEQFLGDVYLRGANPDITTYLCTYYLTNFVSHAIFMAGPALCFRRGRLLAMAALFALAIVVLQYALYTGFEWIIPRLGASISYPLMNLTDSIVTNCSITYFVARMYGLKRCPWRVQVVAIICGVLIFVGYFGMEFLRVIPGGDGSNEKPEEQAAYVMFSMISGLIVATLPAIAIERALKTQHPAASIPEAPNDSQPDSPAEIHA